MRVTQHSIATSSLANLQANLGRLSQLQEQMTSGKVINRPSDSPTGTISALDLRAQIKASEQHSRNAYDGVSWLATQDSALSAVNTALQRVRELTLQGASTGSNDATSRGAMAAEVSSLKEAVLGLANTSYLGRPVFGGTTSGPVAFASDGSYVGDDGSVIRRIGPNSTVRVDTSGKEVFGVDAPGSTSVFSLLDKVASDLTSNTAGLSDDLGALDAAMQQVRTSLAGVGSRYSRAETAGTTAEDLGLSLRATLSGVEDIDLPHTIMDVQMQQMAYQTALSATATAIQPSLMDFLR
jgi:flagellar hook-associated protein 3 FlgL